MATGAQISVSLLPLKFFFNGQEKVLPEGQQGFIYNGTTYVPLRFVGEALDKKVSYQGKDYSIYVDDKPSAPTTYTPAPTNNQYKIEPFNPMASLPARTDLLSHLDKTYTSKNFIIHYTTIGHDASTEEYAKSIADTFEQTYSLFITKMGYQGAYTINIQIGTNVSEEGGLNLIAHEFMHVIQYFYFTMDDNQMMVESAATWAGTIASPDSNSFKRHAKEYYASPDVHIDGNRTATILFLYYLDKEHGISIKRIMEAQASGYKGVEALAAVLSEKGKTFEDVYLQFVKDVMVKNYISNSDQAPYEHRTFIVDTAWEGRLITISKNTGKMISEKQIKLPNQPLKVNNLYGTDYIYIKKNSNTGFKVTVDNPNLVLQVAKDTPTYQIVSVTKMNTGPSEYILTLK